jgi:hypothetical protein
VAVDALAGLVRAGVHGQQIGRAVARTDHVIEVA